MKTPSPPLPPHTSGRAALVKIETSSPTVCSHTVSPGARGTCRYVDILARRGAPNRQICMYSFFNGYARLFSRHASLRRRCRLEAWRVERSFNMRVSISGYGRPTTSIALLVAPGTLLWLWTWTCECTLLFTKCLLLIFPDALCCLHTEHANIYPGSWLPDKGTTTCGVQACGNLAAAWNAELFKKTCRTWIARCADECSTCAEERQRRCRLWSSLLYLHLKAGCQRFLAFPFECLCRSVFLNLVGPAFLSILEHESCSNIACARIIC